MQTTLITLLILMIGLSLRNLYYVIWNARFFLHKRQYKITDNPTKFFIVIPMMDEVNSVGTLIRSLNQLKYPEDKVEIVFATTIRERNAAGKNPTHEVILDYIKTRAKDYPQDFSLRVIESSSTTGYVATQNNFAINSLKDEIKNDDFLLFYNADSLPDKNTLLAANAIIREQGAQANVLQQSSLFTQNLPSILKQRQYGAAANGIHQSLWTLKHEVAMTRRQSYLSVKINDQNSILKRFLLTRFTVCVGHGLFVRKYYYSQHPLNEDANIEDTQYGLYQSLEKTPVFTVPVLENSNTPSTFKKVIAQKRGWFKLTFDLTRLLTQRSKITNKKQSRTQFISIVIQIANLYVTWFIHSIFLIGTLIGVLISGSMTLILLWLAFYIIYWLAPAIVLSMVHEKLTNHKLLIRNVFMIWILGSGTIASHSMGPWLAIYDKFSGNTRRIKTEL